MAIHLHRPLLESLRKWSELADPSYEFEIRLGNLIANDSNGITFDTKISPSLYMDMTKTMWSYPGVTRRTHFSNVDEFFNVPASSVTGIVNAKDTLQIRARMSKVLEDHVPSHPSAKDAPPIPPLRMDEKDEKRQTPIWISPATPLPPIELSVIAKQRISVDDCRMIQRACDCRFAISKEVPVNPLLRNSFGTPTQIFHRSRQCFEMEDGLLRVDMTMNTQTSEHQVEIEISHKAKGVWSPNVMLDKVILLLGNLCVGLDTFHALLPNNTSTIYLFSEVTKQELEKQESANEKKRLAKAWLLVPIAAQRYSSS